ncbi:metal-sulfur cluster assembly factor [Geminicoccus harenae]|uniref:metal-sulfur cluster assembly factor n=2 Tax=Geminicoccus harenae TaxID=2498453 RepID=UPI001C97C060|nr:iron-sulfur cluster assembly protein [Geminicoccus harenae]
MILGRIEGEVRAALRQVDDPELGVSIVDLGLVQSVAIAPGQIDIVLMMTTPTCPIGRLIAETAELAVRQQLGSPWTVRVAVDRAAVWTPERAAPTVRAAFAPRPSRIGRRLKAGLAQLFARA